MLFLILLGKCRRKRDRILKEQHIGESGSERKPQEIDLHSTTFYIIIMCHCTSML